MSQRITAEVAATLKKGDVLYHNIIEFGLVEGEKEPATCTVTGKMKLGGAEGFTLPIHRNYCGGSDGAVSKFSTDLWRTVPEKVKAPARVTRTRQLPLPAVEEAPEDAPVIPARVRRTRR